MGAIFTFKCSTCGEIHEGSPSFGFDAPAPFSEQTTRTQEAGSLDTDLCQYTDEEGEHFFARVVIEIPIHGIAQPFLWGVWVSLSEESFEHYVETYDEPVEDVMYFGWLSNYLPYYESTYALATDVHPRKDGDRPYLAIHKVENELYKDFVDGISPAKAQKIAELCMHGYSSSK